MTRILLKDAKTGETEKEELEYERYIPEELEIEILRRTFAHNLVAGEWCEAGRADIDIMEGTVLKDNSMTEYMKFRAEKIEREKFVTAEILDRNNPTENVRSIHLRNKKTGEEVCFRNKWSPGNTKDELAREAEWEAAFEAIKKKWKQEGRIQESMEIYTDIILKLGPDNAGQFQSEYIEESKNWEVISFEE